MNPALENVAMSLGKPVGAFPGQDHLAHIQVHLDYAKDPMYGSNPIIAPVYVPAMLEHLKQHLTLAYLDTMDNYTSQALGRPFNILKEEPVMREAQQLLAASSQHFAMDSPQMFGGVAPVVQQMMGIMQQLRQMQMPQDPAVQALVQTQMAETQRKSAYDQADLTLKAQKMSQDGALKEKQIQTDVILNTENKLTEERIKSAELSHDAAKLQQEQMQTAIAAQNAVQSSIGAQNG